MRNTETKTRGAGVTKQRMVALVACVPCLGAPAAAQPGEALEGAFTDFRQVVQAAKDRVFPAVLYIACVSESNVEGKRQQQQVTGSGVIVSPEGQALTNWHVIDKAQSVRVLLSDGRHYDATVLGSDKECDVALIQLEGVEGALPHAVMGDSKDLREGDFVMAMGAPWGLNRSVSIGIVSCTTRFLDGTSEYSLWIQTDAAINPGNSGGPLVNTQGEVVGLNTRGMNRAEGMGFAVPSETIAAIAPELRSHGAVGWSWTGLQLQPLRDFNKNIYFDAIDGVIVAETDPDSPARRAGFQGKDRIVRVNGASLTALTTEDLPAVRRFLGLLPKGEEATFDVARGTDTLTLNVTPREKGKVEGDELALERWDFTIKAINQFDNPGLYFNRKEGVFVFGVKYPGNGAAAGLREQDILVSVEGEEVRTIEDARRIHARLVADVNSKHRASLSVLRAGLPRQLVLDFQRDYSRD